MSPLNIFPLEKAGWLAPKIREHACRVPPRVLDLPSYDPLSRSCELPLGTLRSAHGKTLMAARVTANTFHLVPPRSSYPKNRTVSVWHARPGSCTVGGWCTLPSTVVSFERNARWSAWHVCAFQTRLFLKAKGKSWEICVLITIDMACVLNIVFCEVVKLNLN